MSVLTNHTVFFYALFIFFVGRPGDIVDFMKNDWITVTMNNWSLWAPANSINFTFIPGPYQVLFANFTGVLWNCYISWKSHHNAHAEEHDNHDDAAATATATAQEVEAKTEVAPTTESEQK